MKQEIQNRNRRGRQTYVPASVEVIEVTAQRIICQSGGIDNMTVDPDGGDLFDRAY